jgi:hypothetical protein
MLCIKSSIYLTGQVNLSASGGSISNDQNNHCVGTDRIEKLALPIINVLELLQLNKNIDIFEAITYSSAME